ncbi:hypothetical protein B566_EDAN004165 [Ephemera danica]|nr:hypothetical protein B566_EDAN004165 [Ephemera danica]
MARVLIFALLIAEKNGRFPVSGQCDKYIECVDGEASEKLCPDGLLFNDKVKFHTYPCHPHNRPRIALISSDTSGWAMLRTAAAS